MPELHRPYRGSHSPGLEPRAAARFAAFALGSPVSRFQQTLRTPYGSTNRRSEDS